MWVFSNLTLGIFSTTGSHSWTGLSWFFFHNVPHWFPQVLESIEYVWQIAKHLWL
jgi:hypothetical protein